MDDFNFGLEMPVKARIFKNEMICIPPNLSDLEEREREVVIKILNMLNERDYYIIEAIKLLELCIESLKYAPVIKYE